MSQKRILGQKLPAAATLTLLVQSIPTNTTILSQILIANQDAATGSFRLAFTPDAAPNPESYWFYDVDILANETINLDLGLLLGPTDKVFVYSSSGLISFNAIGVQTPL